MGGARRRLGLHVGALALAPLSIVRAVLSGGLVFLGVLAERYFGFHLGRRQWAGVIITAFGLAVIAITGGQHTSAVRHYSLAAVIAFTSISTISESTLGTPASVTTCTSPKLEADRAPGVGVADPGRSRKPDRKRHLVPRLDILDILLTPFHVAHPTTVERHWLALFGVILGWLLGPAATTEFQLQTRAASH